MRKTVCIDGFGRYELCIYLGSSYLLFFQDQPAQQAGGFLHGLINEAYGSKYLALEEIFCNLNPSTIFELHLKKNKKIKKTENKKILIYVIH